MLVRWCLHLCLYMETLQCLSGYGCWVQLHWEQLEPRRLRKTSVQSQSSRSELEFPCNVVWLIHLAEHQPAGVVVSYADLVDASLQHQELRLLLGHQILTLFCARSRTISFLTASVVLASPASCFHCADAALPVSPVVAQMPPMPPTAPACQ